ncbi:hypothetical protein SAMN05192574_102273 [Mucilaginibacter gossypiicola]|uniref:Uncharacterized protein n=1 Tax=Mucilaginibacter gossypiicola TaxID=551995 RepID=A0A1H8DBM5_9SPHI|nr:hypothetical protein SAMN05192574_102273 [Mucilaginibacter gossypiicola]
MILIANIFIRIFVVCCISTIEHIIAHSVVQLLRRAVERLMALTGSIDALHDNTVPVILFHLTVDFFDPARKYNFSEKTL